MADGTEVASAESTGTTDTAPAGSEAALAANLEAASPSFTQADLDAKVAEATAALKAETTQKYGWAESVTPEQYQELAALAQRAQNDPLGFAKDRWEYARNNPQFAPQIQALIHRTAAGSQGPATSVTAPPVPAQAPGPDLRVQNPDGSITQMYSAERMAEYGQWLSSTLKAELGKELDPLKQAHQESVADKQAREAADAQQQQAGSIVEQALQWQGFAENQDAIAKAYQALFPPTGFKSDLDATLALQKAYNSVVYGKLTAANSSEALADHARRAAATTARPSGGAPVTLARDTRSAEQQLEGHLRALSGAKRTG